MPDDCRESCETPGGNYAAHDHRRKGADREGPQDLFQGKKRPRERSVKGSRDTGDRTGTHQDLGSRWIEPEGPAQKGSDCGTQNRHRPFATRRSTAPEGYGTRPSPGKGRPHGEPASFPSHGSLDIRHVEPVQPAPGALHDPPGKGEPESSEERSICQETRWGQKARGPHVECPIGQIDGTVEGHHAEPTGDPDGHGKGQQDGILTEPQPVESAGEAGPEATGSQDGVTGYSARAASASSDRAGPEHAAVGLSAGSTE